LLQWGARTGLPLLLSSGMATLEEIQTAVRWIDEARRAAGRAPVAPGNLSLLHCTSAYPAPADSLNLRAIVTMAQATGLPVGYSDHSQGVEAALAAVALGATVIEKHLTLDNTLPGPDHLASSNPVAFKRMVDGIRVVEQMLGDGIKRPQAVEQNTREVARRSITAVRELRKGERVAASDLALRRPGTGIAPADWDRVVGSVLAQDVPAHTTLAWSMLDVPR
jgi:N-acetylneuraminate synthase/N,N'-diacetyllegionaminate synthase